MSIQRLDHLLCDHGEDCPRGESLDGWLGTKTLRDVARKHGWRCDDTGDWCPDHMPEGPEVRRCEGTLGERPSWMSPGQYDPCRCRLDADHEGAHWCEHLETPDPREHLRGGA